MAADQPTWDERVRQLRRKYDDLVKKIGMDDVVRMLGDTATAIAGLPGEIATVRERGYAFAGYLERKAEVLAEQWGEVREQAQDTVNREVERAQRQMKELQGMWQRLETQDAADLREKTFKLLEMGISSAQTALDGARSRVEGMFGVVPDNVRQTQTQLRQISGYLDQAEASKVEWLPGEAIFMVNKGEWVRTGKDKEDPDGAIYLTDKRLIFEQDEKVGGRFGFGGEQVKEVLFAVPVGAISGVEAEKKGMLGGIDLVHLTLSSGDYRDLTLEVKGGVDCKWYVQQLKRVMSGEIDAERAIPADETAAEAVRSVPTACPTCGAALPPLVRGVSELRCDYCGTVVRV